MILLDTHALIWWVSNPSRIPARATRALNAAMRDGTAIGVSSISVWEIAMLVTRGRLSLTMEVEPWLAKVEALPFLTFYPVDNTVARRSVALTDLASRDPADRMIVATAIEHGAPLVTADEQMKEYRRVKTVWD
ncbi:MAG: type II toxin-antitoxin system VapC family toxin [Gemmatimonadaceae bacterium]